MEVAELERPASLVEPYKLELAPPVAGGYFERAAALSGVETEDFLDSLLFQPFTVAMDSEGTEKVRVIPPQAVDLAFGPAQSDVMVLAKMPNQEEANRSILQCGTAGDLWKSYFRDAGIDIDRWIISNICWFRVPDYLAGKGGLKKPFVYECMPLLTRAYAVTAPKYVLCFGADALHGIHQMHGMTLKTVKFDECRGVVMTMPDGAKVVACIHPARVLQAPELLAEFHHDLNLFKQLIEGNDLYQSSYEDLRLSTIDTFEDLNQLVTRLLEEGHTRFSLDLEWGADTTIRTAQLAWTPRDVAVIRPHLAGMVKTELGDDMPRLMLELERLLKREGVGLVGHNLRGDIQVLRKAGLDLSKQFLDTSAGSFDTMLGHHLLNELSDQQLELVAIKLLRTPRWDKKLRDWLSSNGKTKADIALEGYGNIPDEILIPYAAMDTVVPLELADLLTEQLKAVPTQWSHYVETVHPVNDALDEMESTGVLVDESLLMQLSDLFGEKRASMRAELQGMLNWSDSTYKEFKPLLGDIRNTVWEAITSPRLHKVTRKASQAAVDAWIASVRDNREWWDTARSNNDTAWDALTTAGRELGIPDEPLTEMVSTFMHQWPKYLKSNTTEGFNPESSEQVREVLFGRFKESDPNKRASPPYVQLLNLKPVKATDDTPWDSVEEKHKAHLYNPSTDGESLGIIASEHKDVPFIKRMQQYRFVAQIAKNFVRPYIKTSDGRVEWEPQQGIGGYIGKDGRMRTRFRQTLETGRFATSPNQQNYPNRREKELGEIFQLPTGSLDPRYRPIRQVFVASPGCVLVEADWNQAELWTLGSLARDDGFLHALSTSDLHTETMKKMFGPQMFQGRTIASYETEALNKLRKNHAELEALRISAKTVNFGIPYGRGGQAIAREVSREGVVCTPEDGKTWIAAWHEAWKNCSRFLQSCKNAVIDPGYIDNPYGRRRHFPETQDEMLISQMQREATNFPKELSGEVKQGEFRGSSIGNYRRIILSQALRATALKVQSIRVETYKVSNTRTSALTDPVGSV